VCVHQLTRFQLTAHCGPCALAEHLPRWHVGSRLADVILQWQRGWKVGQYLHILIWKGFLLNF